MVLSEDEPVTQRIGLSRLESGHSLLILTGDFDLADRERLRDAFNVALDLSEHAIVDGAEVTFADSSLITALIEARTSSESRGGSFSLARPSTILRKLLFLAQAEREVPTAPSIEAAAGLVTASLGTSSR